MLQYLALIARLTSNFLKKSSKKITDRSMYNEPMGYEGDSDSDSDEQPAANREATINTECIHMMNDNNSCILQACTNAGQHDWTGEALEQISAISHHLLLSHKMAVHIYKYEHYIRNTNSNMELCSFLTYIFCIDCSTRSRLNRGFYEHCGTGRAIWNPLEAVGTLRSVPVGVVLCWRPFRKV
jgi:hypothetical protein